MLKSSFYSVAFNFFGPSLIQVLDIDIRKRGDSGWKIDDVVSKNDIGEGST